MHLVLLSPAKLPNPDFLPALQLLSHETVLLPLNASIQAIQDKGCQAGIIDGTDRLMEARNGAQLIRAALPDLPLLMVLSEGGFAAVSPTWLVDDIVFEAAGPAELEARLRMLPSAPTGSQQETTIRCGAILIDEASYTARINGLPLNLTYKEFELLKFFAQNPSRVFTRAQLLSEVWGHDYFGGTRTVDVHVRRLRAKLGTEHEHLISTVRNVGYSLDTSRSGAASKDFS